MSALSETESPGDPAEPDKRWETRRALSDPEVRASTRKRLEAAYERHASIRDLVERTGYSFGTVRNLLLEAGVILRGRGQQGRQDHRDDGPE